MLDEDDLREIGIQNPEHIRYPISDSLKFLFLWKEFAARFWFQSSASIVTVVSSARLGSRKWYPTCLSFLKK